MESLAFTKKEMVSILDRVVANCIPKERRKIISDLLSNEEFHYIELQHYNFWGQADADWVGYQGVSGVVDIW